MNKHFGTAAAVPPRVIKRLLAALVVGVVGLGLPLLTMGPASAHTPNLTKSCSGVTVSGSSYESRDTNTLGIRIDGGAWATKTFATSGTLTVAVPQDGVVHTYDAYVHTTNPNQAYAHDYSGTVGPCGNKHVTAVLWEKTDPSCATDGVLVTKPEPTGITVGRSPSGTGPGHYTITFTAQSGYTLDGATSQTIDVLPRLTGDQCATVVQPIAPTVTNPSCTGPGTGTPGSFVLPADGGGIGYSAVGDVVAATADAAHKFGSLPSGWTPVDAHHATYAVSYTAAEGYPACLDQLPAPIPPVAAEPTCDTDGDLVVGTTPHVVTRVDGDVVTEDSHYGAGDHEVSYTADSGYTFADGTLVTVTITVAPKTLDCPATPVAPVVSQSVCDGPGTHTAPVVTTGEPGDHIGYVYDDVTHVVTATADAGFALADLPQGWVPQKNGSATYDVTLTDPGPCLVPVDVPTPPGASAPTCSVDGAVVVTPTEHVVTTVDGDVVTEESGFGPGEHSIGYAPANGYAFTGEVVTAFHVTVLPKTGDCPAQVVAPTVTQSVCTGQGTHSDPVVTLGDVEGDHVSYAYDATTHVVSATPDAGFALADLTDGWTVQEDGSAAFPVVLTDPGSCETVVSPPTSTPGHHPVTHPPSTLPNTGASGSLLALAGLGLALVLSGGLVLDRRRRH